VHAALGAAGSALGPAIGGGVRGLRSRHTPDITHG
jgi:hypothetical protein